MSLWSLEMVHMLYVRQVYVSVPFLWLLYVHWIHDKYNVIKGTMCPDLDFIYASCLGIAIPID